MWWLSSGWCSRPRCATPSRSRRPPVWLWRSESRTYVLSGLLLVLTGVLFDNGSLSANTLTLMWCIVFFFASAGASAAYLTVSEIFPMETRAMAIAFFYAVGTGLGGIVGPIYFGKLIEEGREGIVRGYYVGAALMIAAGIVELVLGVNAEKRSLEDITTPLSAEEAERDGFGGDERRSDQLETASPGSSRRHYH